jgi:hypothetical protein
MSEHVTANSDGDPDDAADLQTVATLLGRAGLRLPADQIAVLVPGFRSDRAGFERLRATLNPEDETAHTFRASGGSEHAEGTGA